MILTGVFKKVAAGIRALGRRLLKLGRQCAHGVGRVLAWLRGVSGGPRRPRLRVPGEALWPAGLVAFLFFLLIPLGCAAVVEVINQQGLTEFWRWISHSGGYFYSGALFFLGLLLFFSGATGSMVAATALSGLPVLILDVTSFFKMAARGEPFYAGDFRYAGQIAGVAGAENLSFHETFVFALLFLAAAVTAAALIRPLRGIRWRTRGIMAAAGLGILALFCFSGLFVTNTVKDYSYQTKGFVVGFAANVKKNVQGEEIALTGAAGSEAELLSVLDALKEKVPPTREPARRPNVIIVLSESFFDITRLPGLTFSEEPIPNFKEIAKTATTGNLYSPTFGGGTAGVEYELLTGFLNRYYSYDSSAYETLLTEETMSLASVFSGAGYESVALHTYKKEFYARDKAYPLLGFDRFIGLEDLEDPKYSGTYVSDDVLTEMIIREYENKTGPIFMLAISMENHQQYGPDKYESNPITVRGDALSEEVRAATESFVHGLHNADKALGDLAAYFEAQEEETYILFFGDHQPAIGRQFGLMYELGVVDNRKNFTPEELSELLRTEFLLWSNTGEPAEHIEAAGPNFLGNYVLSRTGVKKPLFYHFLDEVYTRLHVMSRYDFYVTAGGAVTAQQPEEYAELDALYKTFQTELLYGNGRVKAELMTPR